MKITPELFHAYLKCPTKCWLRANGEPPSGNPYAEWVQAQNQSYRLTETRRLVSGMPDGEVAVSPDGGDLKSAQWRLATSLAIQGQVDSCVVESEVHAVERMPSEGRGKAAQFIPLRFVFFNKLGKDYKLLLALDAFVLSKVLGRDVNLGKIIHGDDHATLNVKRSALAREVRKRLETLAALLSNTTPPDLILNRHCGECEFQARCRKIAVEKDDLSLLAGMSAKERQKLRSKGIFTVTQLSYTFRPRRTPKRAKNPAKPRYLSLQALAIRENTVYFHGTPVLPQAKTQIYLDIEGLPDRNFYYLIGILIITDGREAYRSFWAETQTDEPVIFAQLIETIEQIEDFRVFHFGDYDTTALKNMKARLTEAQQKQLDIILGKCTNVLSALYPHVYFPIYSNGLKDIGRLVAADCPTREMTGLHSIIWRSKWEARHELTLKDQLIEYNRTDCVLLNRLCDFMVRQTLADDSKVAGVTVGRTQELLKVRPRWQMFAPRKYTTMDMQQINRSAYFDYQREKVLVRTHRQFKAINRRHRRWQKTNLRPNQTVLLENKSCPNCGSKHFTIVREMSRALVDLKFLGKGVKKWIITFRAKRYHCLKCKVDFSS